jgi:hypothetical protein
MNLFENSDYCILLTAIGNLARFVKVVNQAGFLGTNLWDERAGSGEDFGKSEKVVIRIPRLVELAQENHTLMVILDSVRS